MRKSPIRARTPAIEEPRYTHRAETRVVMDSTRLTQFGTWEGTLAVEGTRTAIAPTAVLGTRDRSWGVRPVGEPEGGAPGMLPQFFWLWAPIHFDDACTLLAANEDAAGRPWHASGSVVGVPDGPITAAASVAHRVRWQPGTRWCWEGSPAWTRCSAGRTCRRCATSGGCCRGTSWC